MNRNEGWNPLVWLLAGLLGLSLVPRPQRKAEEPRASGGPPTVVDAAVVESRDGAGWLRGALPALRLIGAHLGVSADPGTEVAGAPDAAQARDRLRRVEAALEARPLDCSGSLLDDAFQAARAVRRLAGSEKDAWGELVERARADAEVVGLVCRARTAADARGLSVRFVVATLPDYVEGSSGWDTDQRLEAIQKAAADAGFASDRFYLPGWAPERATAERAAQSLQDDVEPGALLFRRYGSRPGGEKRNELLVVLFAAETATLGVHREALLAAIALATAWDPGADVSMIGPSFSGSALSIRAALDTAFAPGGPLAHRAEAGDTPAVRVLSGSATAARNRAQITTPLTPFPGSTRATVSFAAMTATDDDHLCALEEYLSSSYEGWGSGSSIAILRESNTGWGGGLGTVEPYCPGKMPRAYVFPFPAQISRLRAQAFAGAAETKVPSGARVHLELEEAVGTDRVPAVAPQLTSAMAEVVMGNILDGLERLGVTAVGIYATDKRDHLFLAHEISRRVPSVQIFALEGNLVYLHPDYRSYVRGTLVVGSYPLFFPTQGLAGTTRTRHQFASMAAEGTYNAVIAHLAEGLPPDERQRLLARMVDYDDCEGGRGSCGPSVWIGMVGRDAIWPVQRTSRHGLHEKRLATIAGSPRTPAETARLRARAESHLRYSWPRPLPDDARPDERGDAIRLPRWAALVGLLALAGAAMLCLPWTIRRCLEARWPSPAIRLGLVQAGRAFDALYPPGEDGLPWRELAPRPSGARLDSLRREHSLGLVACATAVACVAFWLATALAAAYLRSVPDAAWWAARVSSVAIALVLSALSVRALWPLPRHDGPSLVRRGLVALPVVATLVFFGLSAPSPRLMGPLATFGGQRFLTMSSLVSPTVPVFFFAATVMAWGLWRLRQVQLQSATVGAGSTVTDLAGGALPSGGLVLAHELNYPYLHVGPWGLLLVGAAALAQALYGLDFRHTGEGSQWFGLFLWSSAILATVLMGFTLTNAVRLGGLLLAGTRALERHPLRLSFATLQRLGLFRRYSLSAPGTEALAPLVRQAGALASAIREDARRVSRVVRTELGPTGERIVRAKRATDVAGGPPSVPCDPDCDAIAAILQIRAGDVAAVLSDVGVVEKLGPGAAELALPTFFHASPLWPRLEALSELLVRSLERGPWASSPFPAEAAPGEPSVPRLACHAEAETFLALQVSLVIRLVLARVLSGITLVVAGLVLVLCAHLFYSFPGRPFWLAWDAALVAAATAVVLWLLARLERDPILSRLAGTAPGELSWSGGFSLRMIAYAAVAGLTLFATFFPEVGSSIAEWVEPVRKSLP